MNSTELSVSVIIPTAYRWKTLQKTLEAIASQTLIPCEIIIADGVKPSELSDKLDKLNAHLRLPINYLSCRETGAAVQRNEGAEIASSQILFFIDDDVYPEPDCISKVVDVFNCDKDQRIGAVGCILSNFVAYAPSTRAKRWFDFLSDKKLKSYSGKVIGPALNFYPDPTVQPSPIKVDWLDTGCVAFLASAFRAEKFDTKVFQGYSFMEDVDLSLRVGRSWELLVQTQARAFHDIQSSRFKKPFTKARMAVKNRYHVMTNTLHNNSLHHHVKFVALIFVSFIVDARNVKSLAYFRDYLTDGAGRFIGFCEIMPSTFRNLMFRDSRRNRLRLR